MSGIIVTVVFLAIVGALVLYVIAKYNSLVKLRQRARNAFAQIDVQLKRRYDLIPNLVETAKAYMAHERETLEAVIAARNQAVSVEKAAAQNPTSGEAIRQLQGAERVLGGAMGRLFAVLEAYPDLKASQNMMQLSEELTSTENKVAFARQHFNDSVTAYNIELEQFPGNLVGNTFKFEPAAPFEIELIEERQPPKVSFGMTSDQ